MYAAGTGVLAVVSLLLVTSHAVLGSREAASHALVVYAINGAGLLALNVRLRRPLLAYLGLGLWLGAAAWALWWQTAHVGPLWAATFAAIALTMAAAAAFLDRCFRAWPGPGPVPFEGSVLPLRIVAEIAALVGVVLAVATAWLDQDIIYRAPPRWSPPCAWLRRISFWPGAIVRPDARGSPRQWPWQRDPCPGAELPGLEQPALAAGHARPCALPRRPP